MSLIAIEKVSIGFRGPLLLDDVSAVIEPKQKIGLLGRNGAGKTTLMRLLSGELQPDQAQSLSAQIERLHDLFRMFHNTLADQFEMSSCNHKSLIQLLTLGAKEIGRLNMP